MRPVASLKGPPLRGERLCPYSRLHPRAPRAPLGSNGNGWSVVKLTPKTEAKTWIQPWSHSACELTAKPPAPRPRQASVVNEALAYRMPLPLSHAVPLGCFSISQRRRSCKNGFLQDRCVPALRSLCSRLCAPLCARCVFLRHCSLPHGDNISRILTNMLTALSSRVAWPWQTGVGTGDHQCRKPAAMSRASSMPRARRFPWGGLGGLLLGLLVVVDVLPRAEATTESFTRCSQKSDCALACDNRPEQVTVMGPDSLSLCALHLVFSLLILSSGNP